MRRHPLGLSRATVRDGTTVRDMKRSFWNFSIAPLTRDRWHTSDEQAEIERPLSNSAQRDTKRIAYFPAGLAEQAQNELRSARVA
jgi:hypothetical protein